MKKYVYVCLALILSGVLSAQVYKFRATSFSFKYESVNSQWADWTDCYVLVTVDTDIKRFVIYSDEKQVYDIISDHGQSIDTDGDDVWKLTCVDVAGKVCKIRLVVRNSSRGEVQIYIDYNDIILVYNLDIL